MKGNNENLENGVLTNSMDTKTQEFREFELFLANKANALTDQQKLRIELLSLQLKMEDYLVSDLNKSDKVTTGEFVKLYLDKLGIKQKKFAEYIGINASNFNKILSGERKINFELSFILGKLFRIDSEIWMQIQLKNEYLDYEEKADIAKYKLEDLIQINE